MKKYLFAMLAAAALSTAAETNVTLLLSINVDASRAAFKHLAYAPETVVTNTLVTFETVDLIITNGLLSGGAITTNSARQQVVSTTISTNAAHWSAPFDYKLGKTVAFTLAGMTARLHRPVDFEVSLEMTPAQMATLFGDPIATRMQSAAEAFGPLSIQDETAAALQKALDTALRSTSP